MNRFSELKYLFVDVDGTLTDSGIYYDNRGNELKKFSTRDYVGVLAAHYVGIEVIILTGREFEGTVRRARELKIDALYQNVKDKKRFIVDYLFNHNINSATIGYIGDDLNDFASMRLAGFTACPSDASIEIKKISNYISSVNGGYGVLQDVLYYILNVMEKWDSFMEEIIADGYKNELGK